MWFWFAYLHDHGWLDKEGFVQQSDDYPWGWSWNPIKRVVYQVTKNHFLDEYMKSLASRTTKYKIVRSSWSTYILFFLFFHFAMRTKSDWGALLYMDDDRTARPIARQRFLWLSWRSVIKLRAKLHYIQRFVQTISGECKRNTRSRYV